MQFFAFNEMIMKISLRRQCLRVFVGLAVLCLAPSFSQRGKSQVTPSDTTKWPGEHERHARTPERRIRSSPLHQHSL